jgi:uncharacterized metal-binding protein
MADGKTHAAAYRKGVIFSVVVSLALAITVDPFAIAGPLGAIGGMLIDPDLSDQHQVTTYTEHRLWRFFPPLGFIFQCYWFPPALLIPHRSWISHWPIVGTTWRILYQFGPLLAYILVYGYGLAFDPLGWLLWLIQHWDEYRWLGWVYLWWVYQDFVHLKLDL